MEELVKKQDRRVLRTKKSIRSAFLKLLATKGLDKISVKEIADNADVDRKTVYNYYNGVYDILDELEDELMQDFAVAIERFDFVNGNVQDIFLELAQILKKREEIYSLLMRIEHARVSPRLVVHLRELVKQVLARIGSYPEDKIAVVAEYITLGVYVAYRHWFNAGQKEPIEDFTLDICRLVVGGASSYLKGLV